MSQPAIGNISRAGDQVFKFKGLNDLGAQRPLADRPGGCTGHSEEEKERISWVRNVEAIYCEDFGFDSLNKLREIFTCSNW